MNLTSYLQDLAVALLGVLSGVMLLVAVVLVPFWRAADTDEFSAWFAAHAHRIQRLAMPIGIVAALSTTLIVARAPGVFALGSAIATWAIAALYPLYFRPINLALIARKVGPDEIGATLARWAAMHWLRVALGIAALIAQLASMRAS
jgi:hypothetical protein